ncbi:UDP-3-O-acyl-N-acetylglucosamine deacetylase [Nodularia spumigena CS-584]|jgi:UDP-3-O-[3-hydroxymyristoyl] N-acetylglucosamine deacetylase|uniref:UDP-3-O-acyl-N-acetylglucosamine deacetylase n=3 Tax=Nodularia spumigena TaxID=70799 RepID=A0A2S0Q795_NODSP|nr:UDP-3-O-acyl-N-acetylglucosamine deacetylase [Nodularia spumigena]AHJ30697.1 UDP-3-O-[3-hydroxymyristoyl] N-acetylglucosamine deacetylase [Nodularia spumigena CCY9414]AVZ30247.1 UDP-3-O-[3-hydroxymyristoyl] N-acetylglucosamine deacetylase [Nodularia spumigena UHCC 0039]EAW45103.1 UDP-3-O-[3-hydroxymyristoyl] N-acetylglucosamine deacetylase [Nodularia spumigena CCY9414]MDB9384209.1 UDP-3-O-acyl-N-acetylglucosamine deacetylase [Nodularia spumigena CS-584]MEA5525599.1 UDP-3-O-acyl-N-acetylgluc
MQQHTIAGEITQAGVGLHSGVITNVRILPSEPDTGRYFVRVDLPDLPIIPAQVAAVNQTLLSTQLGKGEACIRTVEHLLAALAGMSVDNARIEIDGSEVPLLDGSARVWTESIAQVGLVSQPISNPVPWVVKEPIWIYENDAFACALPASTTRFSYEIDFALSAIGNQWHSWSLSGSFAQEIAPARTFGLLHQIEHLQKTGLIKGGSLDNALVFGSEGLVNPPLRFENEPVRHKILDLVGDLSLLGTFPQAHFLAYKASHNLHIQLARKIWELQLAKV